MSPECGFGTRIAISALIMNWCLLPGEWPVEAGTLETLDEVFPFDGADGEYQATVRMVRSMPSINGIGMWF
jgi:hypothetical protein